MSDSETLSFSPSLTVSVFSGEPGECQCEWRQGWARTDWLRTEPGSPGPGTRPSSLLPPRGLQHSSQPPLLSSPASQTRQLQPCIPSCLQTTQHHPSLRPSHLKTFTSAGYKKIFSLDKIQTNKMNGTFHFFFRFFTSSNTKEYNQHWFYILNFNKDKQIIFQWVSQVSFSWNV